MFEAQFGPDADVALDLMEIVDRAWHDTYGDLAPPPRIVEDMLIVSEGHVSGLVAAARLGLTDWRELRAGVRARRLGT